MAGHEHGALTTNGRSSHRDRSTGSPTGGSDSGWQGMSSFPVPRTMLIGREQERAWIRRALCQERSPLITLTGPGGVGKTRLAIAGAGDALPSFSDDVHWVDLEAIHDPVLIEPSVAMSFG